jgi:Holliday junction DNA helicase RuvB
MKWKEFVGQDRIKGELFAILEGRKKYGLPNLILGGPYGCGKTTLAKLFAKSISSDYTYFETGDSPLIYKVDWSIVPPDIVIIDEIHLVKKWEAIYPLLSLACVIGATTEPGAIDLPFLSRCTLLEFDEYTEKELEKIAKVHLSHIQSPLDIPLNSIIIRSRGTPRVVVNLAIRLMRYLDVHKIEPTEENTEKILTDIFQIDHQGLTNQDKLYLKILKVAERPVGLNTICAATGFDKDYVTSLVEPFLLRKGFISRTSAGRIILPGGLNVLEPNNVA